MVAIVVDSPALEAARQLRFGARNHRMRQCCWLQNRGLHSRVGAIPSARCRPKRHVERNSVVILLHA